MIQLLFFVLLVEGAATFLLLVKIGPLRELVMRVMDQVKMGKGPLTVKTIACTMFAIFLSSVSTIFRIHNKGSKLGTMTPMDQVLYRSHLLEACLIGFLLFLGLVLDRLHHYFLKWMRLKASSIDLKKERDKVQEELKQLKSGDLRSSDQVEVLERELSAIRKHCDELETKGKAKDKKLETTEAHVGSMQKQMENFLLDYDKLLGQNQDLHAQLSTNKT